LYQNPINPKRNGMAIFCSFLLKRFETGYADITCSPAEAVSKDMDIPHQGIERFSYS